MQYIKPNDRDADGKPIIYNSAADAGLIKGTWNITQFAKESSVNIPAYVGAEDGSVLCVSNDGRKIFYFASMNGAFRNIVQQTMMPFKTSTLAYNDVKVDYFNRSLFISPDGLNWYGMDSTGLTLIQLTSSSPFVLPTSPTPVHSLLLTDWLTTEGPYYGSYASVCFKPDGTKMYVNGFTSDYNYKVFQFSLSTAWDISTATYDSKYIPLGSSDKNIVFSPDGTKMFWERSGTIYSEPLATAWDVSTYQGGEATLTVLVSDMYGMGAPAAFCFNEAGNKLFVFNGTKLDTWKFVG